MTAIDREATDVVLVGSFKKWRIREGVGLIEECRRMGCIKETAAPTATMRTTARMPTTTTTKEGEWNKRKEEHKKKKRNCGGPKEGEGRVISRRGWTE